MLMAADTKVLVVHRRLFSEDQGRFFVGVVDGYENGVAKVTGRTWSQDQYGSFVKKDDLRTKIISLASGTLIVYQLPNSTSLASVQLRTDPEDRVILTDGKDLAMDLTERLHR